MISHNPNPNLVKINDSVTGVAKQLAEGLVTLLSAGPLLTDALAIWTINMWKGYVVTSGGESHRIISNSATALTIEEDWTNFPDIGAKYIINLSPKTNASGETAVTIASDEANTIISEFVNVTNVAAALPFHANVKFVEIRATNFAGGCTKVHIGAGAGTTDNDIYLEDTDGMAIDTDLGNLNLLGAKCDVGTADLLLIGGK